MGPFINDHGDCKVPIEFEASQILQTDSEVLLTDSNLTWNSTDSLTLNSRTKDGGCLMLFTLYRLKLLDD